jgi:hypothetical protein
VRPFDRGQLFPSPPRLISYPNNHADGNHGHRSRLPADLVCYEKLQLLAVLGQQRFR